MRTQILTLLAFAACFLSACQADPPPAKPKAPTKTEAKPDAKATPKADPTKSKADPTKTQAPKEEAKPKAAAGPGLLPDPNFTIKTPGLKTPGGKGNLIGTPSNSKTKPRLLDTNLKAGQ